MQKMMGGMMPKGQPHKSKDDENLINNKICSYINDMDAEIKDRFKALQTIAL